MRVNQPSKKGEAEPLAGGGWGLKGLPKGDRIKGSSANSIIARCRLACSELARRRATSSRRGTTMGGEQQRAARSQLPATAGGRVSPKAAARTF